MASLTLTIPNSATTRVLNAVCQYGNYSATLRDGSANPQTQAEIVKQFLINYVKTIVIQTETRNAQLVTQTDVGSINFT